MVQVSANTLGVDFQRVTTTPDFETGTIQPGTDGLQYQYAKASANIDADEDEAAISLSSGVYVAAASGGSAVAPSVAVPSGSYAWFGLAPASE